MIDEPLLEMLAKSALLAGLALIALRILRARSAAHRSAVASLAIGGLAVLPLTMIAMPDLRVEAPTQVAELLAPPLSATSTAIAETSPLAELDSETWDGVVGGIYWSIALVLGLGLLAGILRLGKVSRQADAVVDPRWLGALGRAQARTQVQSKIALLITRDVRSPVSWGVFRPTIMLDGAALADVEQADAILDHELAHIKRRDWLLLLLGRVATAIYWLNPVVWLLVREAAHLAEEAADDAVLGSGCDKLHYAGLLLTSARAMQNARQLTAHGVAPSRSSLARRVEHVLEAKGICSRVDARWVATSCSAMLGSLLLVSAITPAIAQVMPSPATRAVVERLEHLASPQSRALALAISTGNWDQRRISGDTRFSEPAAIAPLIDALQNADARIRRIAVWGLSEMRPTPGPEVATSIAPLLGDPSASVRGEAARALGDFNGDKWTGAIIELLEDRDAGVRMQAAHALGDLQNPQAEASLRRASMDPDPRVREKVRWALKQVLESKAIMARRGG